MKKSGILKLFLFAPLRLCVRQIHIAIADNGLGMSEEVQSHIFEPFFTTKPIGKGTGLGLSISYQIVAEKHKGKISCDSTLGQGTKFLIELPVGKSGLH
ncbi:MAG: hypothetical protein DSM106950_20510 [Stigonema ocellatum SAG 48.90 = DSM 106950]|nr:hypothetical protein [Stigonema ocellatum SAG 48.90 = DSM 106950]